MEVKDFTNSLFLPLMIQKESFFEPAIVAYNLEGIINSGDWVEDPSGVCYIPGLIKIEVTFDGNINDHETFDPLKAEIFSIVGTTPLSFIDDDSSLMSNEENTNMLKNIINCFSGSVFSIPKSLNIYDSLLNDEWSYRVCTDMKICPCVVDGQFVFECI